MARKKPAKRKSKKVFLFIVEGCTEENYIKLLKRIYKKNADIRNCKGGSAKAVMNEAQKRISENSDDYTGYVVWFDRDTYFPAKDANQKNSLESKSSVEIYISDPCAENWLLAHFASIMPPSAACYQCEKQLKKFITNYNKNDCRLLDKHIDKAHIKSAIKNYPAIGDIPKEYFLDEK
jgi:hypothetical protein